MSGHGLFAAGVLVFFGGAVGVWVWVMRIGPAREDRRHRATAHRPPARRIRCDRFPDHEAYRGAEPRSWVVHMDGDGPDDEAVGFVGFRGPAR